jgi:hypothetical protein
MIVTVCFFFILLFGPYLWLSSPHGREWKQR